MKPLLQRLADKIEPTDAELKAAGKLPPYSRVARMIKQAKDVPEVNLPTARLPGPPQPLPRGVKCLDGQTLVFFDDGSLRTMQRKLTRKEKKALKRKRHTCAKSITLR